MLGLQSLFLIGCHALLAEDPPTLLLLPVGGEVSSALGAEERLQTGQRPSEFTYRHDSVNNDRAAATGGAPADAHPESMDNPFKVITTVLKQTEGTLFSVTGVAAFIQTFKG